MFEKQPWMRMAGDYPTTEREWFGLLCRSVFSAGLGPRLVCGRWPEVTLAFHDWNPEMVARMDEMDVCRLLSDPAVIRNRRKIEACIENAKVVMDMRADFKTLGDEVTRAVETTGMDAAAEYLSNTFRHLGHTSALFFMFTAGLRPTAVDMETDPMLPEQIAPESQHSGIDKDLVDLRRPLDVLNEAVYGAVKPHADDGEILRRYTEDAIVMMLDIQGSHFHVTIGKVYRAEVK